MSNGNKPTSLHVKAWSMLYSLQTFYLDTPFGFDPYCTYIESKNSLFVSKNPSVFSGSSDSHIEDVPHVAIPFASNWINVIFSRVYVRRLLQNFILQLLEFFRGSWISLILLLLLLLCVMIFCYNLFVTFLD